MKDLSFNTVHELICAAYPNFAKGVSKKDFSYKPFYSEFYNLTYGHQDFTDDDLLIKYIKEFKAKSVLEMFGGEGVESKIVARKLKRVNFHVADIASYFQDVKNPANVRNVFIDCVNGDVSSWEDKYDFIFVSTLNASLCEVHTLEDLRDHFQTVYSLLINGGHYVPSFFNDGFSDEDYTVTFEREEPYKIVYDKQYKGFTIEWATVTVKDKLASKHIYYNLAVLRDKSGSLYEAMSVEKHIATSWPSSTLISLAESVGLKLFRIGENRDPRIDYVFVK